MTGSADMLRQGLYLVVDPAAGEDVLSRLEAALRGGVNALQVWNRFAPGQDAAALVAAVVELARPRSVPVFVHERPDLLRVPGTAGIHCDTLTATPAELRAAAGRPVMYGITAGNELQTARRARMLGADYVSFCSIHASASVTTCALVDLETLTAARNCGPPVIIASGGITPDNAPAVLQAGADAIAVISGILSAADPESAARRYRAVIGKHFDGASSA